MLKVLLIFPSYFTNKMIIIIVTLIIILLVTTLHEGFKNIIVSSYNIENSPEHDIKLKTDKYIFKNIKKITSVIDPNDHRIHVRYVDATPNNIRGYFRYLSKSSSSKSFSCSFDLENRIVGYISRTDLYFIRSIVFGYRMNEKRIRLKKLNPVVPDFNSVDCAILYVHPSSETYNTISKQNIFVEGFDNLDIHRVKLFYPSIEFEDIRIKQLFPQNNVLTSVDRYVRVPSASMMITNKKEKENFVTRLDIKDNVLDEQYGCFGEPGIDNAALCNSRYDAFGNKKSYWTIWSKKCKEDIDCPYYGVNKAYPNSFGGCIKKENEKYGSCEGPIGVKQIGFTKFYDKGKYAPFCETNNVRKTCNAQNADFRFANDQELRKANSLSF